MAQNLLSCGSSEERFLAAILYCKPVTEFAYKVYTDFKNEKEAFSKKCQSNLITSKSDLIFNGLFMNGAARSLFDWAMKWYEATNCKNAPGSEFWLNFLPKLPEDETFKVNVRKAAQELQRDDFEPNTDLLISDLQIHFDRVRLHNFVGGVKTVIDATGRLDDVIWCVNAVNGFKRLETAISSGVNLVSREPIVQAYANNDSVSLLTFENMRQVRYVKGDTAVEESFDFQRFFGDTFSRSSFVVINAAEKTGKSMLMMNLAWIAMNEGRKVAYFEAGDMSQVQVSRRLYQRISEHPRRAGVVQRPVEFWVEGSGTLSVANGGPFGSCDPMSGDYPVKTNAGLTKKESKPSNKTEFDVVTNDLTFDVDMNKDIALAKCEPYMETLKGLYKFSAHPQDLSVPLMATILDEWKNADGFEPDFIFVDYADILLPASRNLEFRHQVNDTFSRLRGLSLAKKCCLVTATQGNANTYDADVMTRRNLSEDKRKAAHPTAILGLFSRDNERAKGVTRLNYLLRRDDVCSERDYLYLAQSMAQCDPMVLGYYPKIHTREREYVRKIAEGDLAVKQDEPCIKLRRKDGEDSGVKAE